jgi:hypothetical protein
VIGEHRRDGLGADRGRAVVGDECLIEPEAYLSAGVRVYRSRPSSGAVVNASVIWESAASAALFGPRGVSGLVNVEITPGCASGWPAPTPPR